MRSRLDMMILCPRIMNVLYFSLLLLFFGLLPASRSAPASSPSPADPFVKGRTLLLRFTPTPGESVDPIMVLEYDALLQHNDAAVEAMCMNKYCDRERIKPPARERGTEEEKGSGGNGTSSTDDIVDDPRVHDTRNMIVNVGIRQTVESFYMYNYGSLAPYLDEAARAEQEALVEVTQTRIKDPKAFIADFRRTKMAAYAALSNNKSSSSSLSVSEDGSGNGSDIYGGDEEVVRALQLYSASLFKEQRFEEARVVDIILLTNFALVPSDVTILTLVSLGEVSRILGYQETAASAVATLIALHSDFNRRAALLCRFRLATFTPVIPDRYALSSASRARIMSDLVTFSRQVEKIDLDTTLHDCLAEHISLPFFLSHQGLNDRLIQELIADLYGKFCKGIYYVAPHLTRPDDGDLRSSSGSSSGILLSEPRREGEARKRIKLGFLSTLFYDHSIGRIMSEVMLYLHLKHSDVFEVHVIMVRLYTGSAEVRREDRIEAALHQHLGDNFHIYVKSPKDVRPDIAALELDVLIFPDIGMDFVSYILAFSRFANYQIVWWGHPITTGIPSDSIDFFFSLDVEVDGPRTEPLSFEADAVAMDEADDFRFSRLDSESMDYRRHMQRLANLSYPTGPETERFSGSRSPSRRGDSAASHYTEQMVRMEYINSIFIEADVSSTDAERAALMQNLRMPADARYCLVPARLFKIHPSFDRVVQGILSQNEDAFVVFIYEKSFSGLNYLLGSRLRALLTGSEMQRIRFGDMRFYNLLTKYATIALDTFPYGGCLTVHEMLATGIPVVTLPSHFVRGRYALAMYQQMGVSGLVAQSEEHYVDIATQLLRNATHRDEMSVWVYRAFRRRLHRNGDVAREWRRFIERLFV